ncbi:DEKNAAC100983 [Brettanomyces naardenensis]|uniref:Mitochondrial 15S rRNA processing factor CCM1 n=1 Tax=Brettanomyces naardenensis TaxID=13370 RepID=A0A448YH08_BRENA|nr:DEKNAAC100983 [Brettanomyces naardenensis]
MLSAFRTTSSIASIASRRASAILFSKRSLPLLSRCYSTSQEEIAIPPRTLPTNAQLKPRQFQRITDFNVARDRGLSVSSQLLILASDPAMNVTTIFDNLESVLSAEKSSLENPATQENASFRHTRLLDVSISLGHRYFSRLHDLNAATDNDHVPDSMLFRRILTIFTNYNLLHVSHLNRVLAEMLVEKQYSKALSVWIESLEFFKANPDRLLEKKESQNKLGKKRHFMPQTDQFFYGGLASYLLSLSENKTKLDPEFVKLILADFSKRPSEDKLKWYLRSVRIPQEEQSFALSQWNNYYLSNIDYNSSSVWRGALKAAKDNKGAKVESLIAHNLQKAAEKGEPLTADTWAEIMRIYNIDKNYQRALQTWNKVTKELQLQPTVGLWNQFLLANVRSNASEKLLRIESVWKLLNEAVQPNSESFRYLIEGYISCNTPSKALEVVTNLKKDSPELLNDDIREDLIVGFIDSGFGEEGEKLFKNYLKDTFKPTIRLYNKLLHHYLKVGNLERATGAIDDLIAAGKTDPRLAPDIATWTTVVDIVLKQARKVGASSDFIVDELQHILSSMKENGIKLNEESLTMLISNLTRNPDTAELGREFFQFMKENKMRISTVAYTSIIYSESASGRMDRALELFQEGLQSGIKLRPQYYNLIFKGYSDHPNVDSSIKFYRFIDGKTKDSEELQQPNFFTFYYLLREALYVEDGPFIKFVVDELDKKKLREYGIQIPRLLKEAESRGIEIPLELKESVTESTARKQAEEKKARVKADYE